MKKQFIILLTLCIIGQLAIIPYTLSIQPDAFEQIPISMPLVILLQVVNTIIISSILILVGLLIAPKVGLGIPIIDRFVKGKNVCTYLKKIIPLSIITGILVGVVILILDLLFDYFSGSIALDSSLVPSIFAGFLASLYGGINEEIMLRLFLMSLIVIIFTKIRKNVDKKPSNVIIWYSIFITAILFGIGHIPIASSIVSLTPLFIVRIMLLNGIGGIVFGWLYWKKGLESAMISHFVADIVLHVIPFLFIF